MSEELKIIISAVTNTAKKNIKDVKDEVRKLGAEGKNSSSKFSKSMSALGAIAKTALKGVAVAIGSVITALTALGAKTKQLSQSFGKLNTAFLSSGSSAEQAGKVYKDLYRFLGDNDKATEAGAHLAKLTTNEKELAEWTSTLQGVFATFGDSLPIEGLTEASNETARVGKVTGVLADALNWAGVNEDAFNNSLAQCTSLSEREALIRNTLNDLYRDASAIYERNNADVISLNEAQAGLNVTLSRVGKSVAPLNIAMINLSNSILSALAPAIKVVSNVLAFFINKIAQAVQWISAFFSLLTGGSKGASTVADNMASITSGIGSAGSGAGALESGLAGATKQAEKLKRATASFDELNKVTDNSSSSGGSSGSAGAGAGVSGGVGGFSLDTTGFDDGLNKSSEKVEAFANKVKDAVSAVKDFFQPAINAIKTVVTDVIDGASSAWKKNGKPFLDEAKKMISGIKDTVKSFWDITLKPIIDLIVKEAGKLWKNNLKPLWDNVCDAVLSISTDVLALWNTTLKPVVDWISKKVFSTIKTVATNIVTKLSEAIATITDVINSVVTVAKGVVKFISGVFTGDWKKAWNGVKTIFKGVFDGLWAVAKAPLNLIIGAINTVVKGIVGAVNTAIKAINKLNIKVPDWVPSIGGKQFGFNIKTITATQIPKLATGGIVTSSILANIGERGKEAVLPLENNTEWMDILAEKIANRNSAPTKVVISLDGKELGWATVKSINSITKQTGKLQLLV